MSPVATSSTTVRARLGLAPVWTSIVVIAGLVLSLVSARWVWQEEQASQQQAFERLSQRLQHELRVRLARPFYGLHGARGLYAGSDAVSDKDFRDHVKSRDLVNEFPGVRAFGFIERVGRDQLASFEKVVRQETGQDFRAHGLGPGNDFFVVRHVQPFEANRAAWGFDVGSEPVRREALERALRTGRGALTGRLALQQDPTQAAGVLYVVPVYRRGTDPQTVEQRERFLQGFVYAPVRLNDLFDGLEQAGDGLLSVALIDGSLPESGGVLYSTPEPVKGGPDAAGLVIEEVFDFGGRRLLIQTRATQRFINSLPGTRVGWTAGVGGLFTVLLAVGLWRLLAGRQRAEDLARGMTADLQRLATVARRTSNAVICTDAEARITWVNPGFTRISGFELEQVLGQSSTVIWKPSDADSRLLQQMREAARQGQGGRVEICGQRSDGSTVWLDTDVQPVFDEQGRLSGYIETSQDITVRKQSESRMQSLSSENNALLSAIREYMVVSVTDAEGVIVSVNKAFCDISQYEAEELIGRTHAVVNSAVQSKEFWAEMWSVIKSGRPWQGKICNRARDGSLYWMDSIIAPIVDPTGRIERYVSIRKDITESQLAATELRLERERLSRILTGTNAGTWECNVQTGSLVVNQRWAAMLGYALEDVRHWTHEVWGSHIHRHDLPRTRQLLKSHFDGDSPVYEAEYRMRHRDGHWVWVATHGTLTTRSVDGRPMLMVGTNLDVSVRKAAEEALRKNQQLLSRAERLSGGGAWEFDLASEQLSWTDQAWRLFDAEPGSIRTLAEALEFFAVSDQELLRQAMQRATEHAEIWDLELELQTRKGRKLWVRSVGEAEFDDGGAKRLVGAFADITARRELEAQTLKSNTVLRSVLENLPCALSVFDAELNLVAHNQQFRVLLEFPDHLFGEQGTRFEDIIWFNARRGEYGDLDRIEDTVAHIIERARTPTAHQMERTRPNGVTLEVRGSPMPGGGFVTTYVDVSQRKRLEADRERGQMLLRAVLESLPCGLTVIDPELNVVLHNSRYDQLYGLDEAFWRDGPVTVETVAGLMASRGEYGPEVTVEEAIAQARERSRLALEGPHHWERERPGGLVLEMRSEPLQGGGFVTTYTDVGERRRAEAEVRSASALLRGAIDTVDEAFVLFGPDDRLVFCNEKYRELYAASADLIVPGALFEDLVRRGAERGQYADAIGRIDEWVAERVAMHRRGDMQMVQHLNNDRWVRVIERRMPDGHTVGFRIDISDLMNAKRAAEEASRSKGQFLANMSHEIRTPMNAILGLLTLLQKTALDAKQVDYVSKTEGAARSLLALLNDILDFSKVEAGKMSLDPQPFDVHKLMRDLHVILSANLGSKRINLELTVAPDVPSALLGDSLRLQQVLINLGGNAVKFTERGAVQISIRLVQRDAQTATLLFSVQDSGIGIAPENQARIFTGFSQAEASTTRRFGGTGLGLAISQRLLQLMNTELTLQSELGRGSRFSFELRLPVVNELALDDATLRSPARPDTDALKGMRLLLVEDNAINQQVATEMLEGVGASIRVADNGRVAVSMLMAEPRAFDAVLMDVQMPVMDGFTATRLLRQDPALAQLPIIAMTANAMSSDRDDCLAAGMNAHVGKPFELPALVALLREWVLRPGGAEQEQEQAALGAAPAEADAALQRLSQRLAQAMPAISAERLARAREQGLDLQQALERMLGRTEFFLRTCRSFEKSALDLPAVLREHVAQQAWSEAERALHSLKGLAATLSAHELASQLSEGEAAIHAGRIPDEAWILSLEGRIQGCCAALIEHAEALHSEQQARVS